MAKENLILGTAGHIDHGKSSLIKALTGTDPDRLAEEKERGITITLGFAQLVLPSGRKMGVVDVPGHERFVRQMVAGATGMDVALLVIAADDGIMPQTVEHMAVLELLGVTACVIALTKSDLVDEDWLAFVKDEIAQSLEPTPFAGAPVIPCSSTTGAGLDELREALDKAASGAQHTKPAGGLRMPVDRAFTVKGFGTVVTGTLWSGNAHLGDELEVLPAGLKTSIRSIQVHGKDRDSAAPGNRVAMCLRDLSLEDVHAGDFLAAPGTVAPTDRFDAQLTFSDPFDAGKPFASGSRVHVAHGTREVIGRVLCMNGAPQLDPKQTAKVQIRLDEPLPLSYQDRFIIRSYSPVHVIGGGSVLVAHPRRRTNLTTTEESVLDALANGNTEQAMDAYALALEVPAQLTNLVDALGLPKKAVSGRIEQLIEAKKLSWVGANKEFVAPPSTIAKLVGVIEGRLMRFHNANPNATGIAKDELRQLVDNKLGTDCFDALLEEACNRKVAVQIDGEVSHPKASAGAKAQVAKAAQVIEDILIQAGGTPPTFDALVMQTGLTADIARKALAQLVEESRVVRISSEAYYSAELIAKYKGAITGFINENGPATAAQLKEACNTSRKYMMPLLEYFDAQGFTKRQGDLRTLRQ